MQPLPPETTPREVQQRMEAGEAIRLIDVREPGEFAVTRISGAELIPMGTVPSRLEYLDAVADEATLIVYCHHGVRSLNVTCWLREQGIAACQSMAGGIDRWSEEVDASVPRY